MFSLNRNHIFLIGLITAFAFAFIHILNFRIKSEFTQGKVSGWYGSDPIVYFKLDGEVIQFAGESNLDVSVGDKVSVIYEEANPKNAAVFSFTGFFMPYFLFLIMPLLFFTAFIYSWFGKYDYVIVNFKKGAEKRISKSKRLN